MKKNKISFLFISISLLAIALNIAFISFISPEIKSEQWVETENDEQQLDASSNLDKKKSVKNTSSGGKKNNKSPYLQASTNTISFIIDLVIYKKSLYSFFKTKPQNKLSLYILYQSLKLCS